MLYKKVRQIAIADKRRGFTDIAAQPRLPAERRNAIENMFKKVEVMKMELDMPHLKKTD